MINIGQYFNQVGIIPYNYEGEMQPLPNNISKDSIPILIRKNIGNNIQNLTFPESELAEGLEKINSEVPTIKKEQAVEKIKIMNQDKNKDRGEDNGRNI